MPAITTFDVQGLGDSGGRITTIGHVFKQGDIPAGTTLAAAFNGVDVAVQLDAKATWPDGSVKHAVLSFENPAEALSGPLTLESVDPEAEPDEEITPTAINVAEMALAQEYAFQVQIDDELVDIAALLESGSSWLSGALTSEVRVTQMLANGLEVRADVRASADGVITTSVVVGNDDILTTGLDAKTYSVHLLQNGDTVFENEALTQPHFTVWRESYTTAEAENTAHVIYDLAYLRQTGLLPSVDDTIELADSTEYYDRLVHEDATFDPLELGGVDNVGGIDSDRGRTGETPSYGLLTDDQHSYLVTQSAETRQAMLALTDQYGAFSNYYRNPETGEAYFLEDTTFNSFRVGTGKDLPGTEGVIDLVNDGLAQRNSVSHKPSEYYLSYLVTGDRYYADGLAHEAGSALQLWANSVYLTDGGHVDFASQLREQAWVLRDLFYAASLSPDGSRASEVLTTRLDAALQDYVDYYVIDSEPLENEFGTVLSNEREGPRFIGGDLEGALQSNNRTALIDSTAIDRPYWQDWFAMVVGQIALTGNTNAIALGEWMAGFGAERFLQDDFDPFHNLFSILNYPTDTGSSALASDATWADLNDAALAVGGVNADVSQWEEFSFYAASAWGGAASAFSGVRDARYAEALLWMTTNLTEAYIDAVFEGGSVPQFGIPVTFADYSIAGVNDISLGTEGIDEIDDGDGNRLINAGDGDDIVTTGAGSHLVEGGDGNDLLRGAAGEDWFFGGSGSDVLIAGAGINYLQGDRHDEDFGRFADRFVFEDAVGTTVIGDFDAGQDALFIAGITGIETAADVLEQLVDTANGAALTLESGETLLLDGVMTADLTLADIVITSSYALVQDGTTGADRLFGTDGQDAVFAADGRDLVFGSQGADRLSGGGGVDWLRYTDSTGGVSIDLSVDDSGFQSATGGDAEGDVLSGFEYVIASAHDDTLLGDEAANILTGIGGSDTIEGRGGNDRITGGADADILDGGAGTDWLIYARSKAGVTIDLNADEETGLQSAAFGNAEGDVIQGFENVSGSGHGDTLTGDAAGNVFLGREGDDTIFGGEGDDSLRGGVGADRLDGGDGNDRVNYATSAEAVLVDLSRDEETGLQFASGGDAEGDVISGFERVSGSRHDDTLVGGDDINVLNGGNGDDLLLSGAGRDRLSGGEGADTFRFTVGDQRDTILDFNRDVDVIEFVGLAFSDLEISTYGAGVRIDFGAVDTVFLRGVLDAEFTEDDFVFV